MPTGTTVPGITNAEECKALCLDGGNRCVAVSWSETVTGTTQCIFHDVPEVTVAAATTFTFYMPTVQFCPSGKLIYLLKIFHGALLRAPHTPLYCQFLDSIENTFAYPIHNNLCMVE